MVDYIAQFSTDDGHLIKDFKKKSNYELRVLNINFSK